MAKKFFKKNILLAKRGRKSKEDKIELEKLLI